MDFSEISNSLLGYFGKETWIAQVFIVVFITAVINWVQKRVLAKLVVKLQRTRTYWDDALFDAARKPIYFLIWIIGLTFAADIVRTETDACRRSSPKT